MLIPEGDYSDYSLPELSKDDDYGIITDDEENMGCQLKKGLKMMLLTYLEIKLLMTF